MMPISASSFIVYRASPSPAATDRSAKTGQQFADHRGDAEARHRLGQQSRGDQDDGEEEEELVQFHGCSQRGCLSLMTLQDVIPEKAAIQSRNMPQRTSVSAPVRQDFPLKNQRTKIECLLPEKLVGSPAPLGTNTLIKSWQSVRATRDIVVLRATR